MRAAPRALDPPRIPRLETIRIMNKEKLQRLASSRRKVLELRGYL